MTDEIKLPPLPEPDLKYRDGTDYVGNDTYSMAHSDEAMEAFARAAILADRAARPVAATSTPSAPVAMSERQAFEQWARPDNTQNRCDESGAYTEPGMAAAWSAWKARAAKVQPVAVPEGFALVPLIPNREMERLMREDDWEWLDLLAVAEAITEEQYDAAPAHPASEPAEAQLADWSDDLMRLVAEDGHHPQSFIDGAEWAKDRLTPLTDGEPAEAPSVREGRSLDISRITSIVKQERGTSHAVIVRFRTERAVDQFIEEFGAIVLGERALQGKPEAPKGGSRG